MITYTTSKTTEDLSGIIQLQKKNLAQNLDENEMESQGFVTVSHNLDDLKEMNRYEQSLVIKDEDKIMGYLLAMTKNSRAAIPILVPMFDVFDKIYYENKPVSTYNYLVVGQVCIDRSYRGQGLLDKAYSVYKAFFETKYDFAITEIATANMRSINAHKRIGFVEIEKYTDHNNTEWSIVLWNWNISQGIIV